MGMMGVLRRAAFVAVLAGGTLGASLAAACPNWSSNPYYGTVNLSAGFLPDPHVTNVQAGGSNYLPNCVSGTAGNVGGPPDVRLIWSGTSSRLHIYVQSGADTVLLVNGPSGQWFFNDDTNGFNPSIVFTNPAQGQYDIWAGTYSGGSLQPAQIFISEF
ncbi:MAG: peptidase S1 [Rubricella sp.]